jgi:hypothetical protein
MAGKGGGAMGGAGLLLALPLLYLGHLISGFTALAFWWALVQADILRLEGRGAALMGALPIKAQTQVDARLHGLAAWSGLSAISALVVLVLRAGSLALLPGAMALVQMHLTGAALGLRASASAPLDGWSLLSIQSLGLMTVCGGTLSGWVMSQALADPSLIITQALLVGLAWILLRRARVRVLGAWAQIQEGLVQG